jgi:hypothetical protein
MSNKRANIMYNINYMRYLSNQKMIHYPVRIKKKCFLYSQIVHVGNPYVR